MKGTRRSVWYKPIVALGIAVVVAAACSGGSGDSGTPHATAALRVLAGIVEVQPQSADFALAVDGQALDEGFTIRTGSDGRAAIEYFDGSVTRLDVNTTFTIVTLQILDNADQSKVIEGEQSSGSTYSRVTELTDSASRFDVTTPTASASVQGTIYAIFVNPVTGVTTVAVLDGTVAVGDVDVPVGFMVTVNEDGTAGEVVPIPDDLIDSDWIVFNCEQDGGVVDADGNCVLGTLPTTTTTSTTVAETTTTSTTTSTTTTTTTTTTTLPHATTTTVPVLDHIVISPDDKEVEAGETQLYTAEGFDQNDHSMGLVDATFYINEDGCYGAYCWSTVVGEYTITADFAGKSDTAHLTVGPAELAIITITPDEAMADPDAPVLFTAYGFDQYLNPLGEVAVAWDTDEDASCDEPGPSTSTNCSASSGEHTITATYDEFVSDTATLTIDEGGE